MLWLSSASIHLLSFAPLLPYPPHPPHPPCRLAMIRRASWVVTPHSYAAAACAGRAAITATGIKVSKLATPTRPKQAAATTEAAPPQTGTTAETIPPLSVDRSTSKEPESNAESNVSGDKPGVGWRQLGALAWIYFAYVCCYLNR